MASGHLAPINGARGTGCFPPTGGCGATRRGGIPGRSFPDRPAAENASQNLRPKRVAVSQTAPFRKPQPTIQANSGMQFPDGASRGNYIPLWGAKTGWAFRLRPYPGTISPQVIKGMGCLSFWTRGSSYRWRSRKRKARRIQGRTATCLSSLSTAVLALPSDKP